MSSQEGGDWQRAVGKAASVSMFVPAGLAGQGAPGDQRTEWVAGLGGESPGKLQLALGLGEGRAGGAPCGAGGCPMEQDRKGSLEERSG